ncbi:amidohydrolase 2 [Aminomonas paucivorans DSM 12260]|uniref:Amidohydrolase 2 n=1 Tax=Aminomonas paucivorans DSM 12260 TaxID=584708 RepID=E3CWI1_9BACT|nr:amidohydrolase family protein [Aminomonas paucivorans]EFQ24336.1 amidohydrolase 2 [Aminomonas paucivorans DSM 12260]
MIIDSHVHIYPPEVVRDAESIGEREPYFRKLTSSPVHRWGTAEDLLARMDADGVDQSWACGFAFADLGLCRLCNDYVLEAAERSGGRLRPLAVVPPLARGAMGEIERAASRGAIGVGELFPQGQGFDLTDPRQTWRLAGVCHEGGLFALVHTAEPVGHDYPGKGDVGPREAAAFCEHHPETPVVFAHFGGGLWLYEQMPEMRRILSNAWYDTAAAPFLYRPGVFDALFASGVGGKLLYGSDFPLLGLPRYRRLLEGSRLGEEDRARLLGGNAQRLLGSLTVPLPCS